MTPRIRPEQLAEERCYGVRCGRSQGEPWGQGGAEMQRNKGGAETREQEMTGKDWGA